MSDPQSRARRIFLGHTHLEQVSYKQSCLFQSSHLALKMLSHRQAGGSPNSSPCYCLLINKSLFRTQLPTQVQTALYSAFLPWLLQTFLVARTCENLPQRISQLHDCSSRQVLASTWQIQLLAWPGTRNYQPHLLLATGNKKEKLFSVNLSWVQYTRF